MGLVPIIDVSDIRNFNLAYHGPHWKCPFGHVGFPGISAKTYSLSKSVVTLRRFERDFSEVQAMTIFLALLIGSFMIAAAIALMRGLKAFLHDGDILRQNGIAVHYVYGVRQNRMMTQRVLFQGIAILLIVVIGALASGK
jgi:Hypoxia induced protein conserved region